MRLDLVTLACITYVYIYIHVCIGIWLHMYVHVHAIFHTMYINVNVYIRVWVCVCVHVYLYVYISFSIAICQDCRKAVAKTGLYHPISISICLSLNYFELHSWFSETMWNRSLGSPDRTKCFWPKGRRQRTQWFVQLRLRIALWRTLKSKESDAGGLESNLVPHLASFKSDGQRWTTMDSGPHHEPLLLQEPRRRDRKGLD